MDNCQYFIEKFGEHSLKCEAKRDIAEEYRYDPLGHVPNEEWQNVTKVTIFVPLGEEVDEDKLKLFGIGNRYFIDEARTYVQVSRNAGLYTRAGFEMYRSSLSIRDGIQYTSMEAAKYNIRSYANYFCGVTIHAGERPILKFNSVEYDSKWVVVRLLTDDKNRLVEAGSERWSFPELSGTKYEFELYETDFDQKKDKFIQKIVELFKSRD